MSASDRDLPRWLSTEAAVRATFELLGFNVVNISIEGRQIDLVATKNKTFDIVPETWIVEITTAKVGEAKGSSDYQKLQLARQRYKDSRALMISTSGFTDDQRATLKLLDVIPLTYDEFESSKINLAQYAQHALKMLQKPEKPDIGYDRKNFVDPVVDSGKFEGDGPAKLEPLSGETWIDETLKGDAAVVCALLGDLGSGKTSLLQRALEVGCQRYLEDRSHATLPIYVQLGRYKQHSGEIEQMLMSEFRRVGLTEYPMALVRHLIDSRRVVLLLDGLDEIHPIQNSDDVLSTVIRILSSVGTEAAAVVSCRRVFLETSKEELGLFGPYTARELAHIQSDLSKRLRGHPTTYRAIIRPFDRTRIDAYLHARCGMTTAQVSTFFASLYGFEDMARTPVLLSMMATAVQDELIDPSMPQDLPVLGLYRAYTDRWIERDMERSRLSHSQRRRVSQSLAVHMLWTSTDGASWNYIKDQLKKQDAWAGNPISNEEAEVDIRKSGFLVRDIDDQYRFAHRSIMEFFAAEAEIGRYRAGEAPRHVPTDGFRLFLSYFIAEAWLSGRLPFADASWNSHANGELAVEAQMTLLASANRLFPKERRARLDGLFGLCSSGEHTFRGVDFANVTWRLRSGTTVLNGCSLTSCRLTVEGGVRLAFDPSSKFARCSFTFPAVPAWTEGSVETDSADASLELPAWVWDLSALYEAGNTIEVAGKQWKLGTATLDLLAQVVSRLLRRGNVNKENFFKGKKVEELKSVFPRLLKFEWVAVDTSHTPHQYSLQPQAKKVVGALGKAPWDVQDHILTVLPP